MFKDYQNNGKYQEKKDESKNQNGDIPRRTLLKKEKPI